MHVHRLPSAALRAGLGILVALAATAVLAAPAPFTLAYDESASLIASLGGTRAPLPATPPILNSEGDALVPPGTPRPLPAYVTAGPTVAAPFPAGFSQEDDPGWEATALAPEPAAAAAYRAEQHRLQAALLAFDATRNAGPAAVIAFAESADEQMRALIGLEVDEARAALAAEGGATPGVQPAAPQANQVGVDGPCAYATIQAAINAAPQGATVRLAGSVTFTENIDIFSRNLVVEGGYDVTCSALAPGTVSRIHAATASSVIDFDSGSVVQLRNLTIRLGASFGAGLDLLGSSQVTISNTDVISNAGINGGGAYVGSGSQLTLTAGSELRNNTGSAGGGAIVYGRLNALDTNSDITGNSSTGDGGGVYVSGGTLYLSGADVHDNAAAGAAGRGGAIFASGGAVVTLTNSSFIGESGPCCNVAYDGGGIYADGSRIYSLGGNSTILQNAAANNGGGLYLVNGSLFSALSGTNVGYDAQPPNGNTAVLGAGMYVHSSTVELAGRIINNTASNSGGGMYAVNSVVTLTNAAVGGTGTNLPNKITPTGLNGAGLYLMDGTRAHLSNTQVTSNTLQNVNSGYGAGLYVRAGSSVTLTNSKVERNWAPSAFDGRGAGVYLYDGTLRLDNSQVLTNTAANLGGGMRLFGTSVLFVANGSSLNANVAGNALGGALAATGTPAIALSDSTMHNNTAATNGGAVYLDAGTLQVTGWWDFRFNQAGGNGGAIAVLGTGNAGMLVTGGARPSYLAANLAGGNGGGVHLGNDSSMELHATSGFPLNLNTNVATNGGAAYADAGGFLDVYGQIQATSNRANGNGGVFYLSGGSRIWLDDYFNTRPQILINEAQNGGAIFASGSPRVECDGVDFGYLDDGNSAATGSGGAVHLSGSNLTADNCVFRNNTAAADGGAIAAYTSTVTLDVDYPATTTLALASVGRVSPEDLGPQASSCNPSSGQCSTLYGNTAGTVLTTTGSGGAVYSSDSRLSLNQTYLHRNAAARGGAVYQTGTGAISYISNTLVYSNSSSTPSGAGIRAAGGAITITHATMANNVGGAGFSPGSVSARVYNSIIWGNSVAAFGALATAVCNIDQGGTAGPVANPLFAAPGGSADLRPLVGSPAIDACNTGLPTDIMNKTRPAGALYDMGAYEGSARRLYLPLASRQ